MPDSLAQLTDAVAQVVEPELRAPLGELGLVRELGERWGKVRVTVGSIAPDHPQGDELVRRVEASVGPLSRARGAEVRLEPLSEADLEALGQLLRAIKDPPDGAGTAPSGGAAQGRGRLGHEEGRPNPFASPGTRTRVIGIASGKGGVGKSSVTVNCAVALAREGHSVAVLDADVYGFSIPKMVGIERSPLVIGDLLVPPVAHEVGWVSLGLFVEEDTPVIWRGPMLHKALEQMLADTWWANPEFLLVDMPPGTGDVALSMAQYLPRSEVLVVTTPQAAARRVAQRSAYMARKLKLPLRGVIENMSWFTGDDGRRYELFGSGGGQALADELGVPLVGQVPLVPTLRQGGDQGVPVSVVDPRGEAAQAFSALAK
ncbi:MAG: Mrp/NBP35 family ATP-binding protein, partial [Acidimicrobiales bacterium]|nr:Mrp/NBP35 family ATP-binding protein [Acidimicrobiales bacterium]